MRVAASRDAPSGHLLFLFSLLYAPCVFILYFISSVLIIQYSSIIILLLAWGRGGGAARLSIFVLFSMFSRPS